MRKQYKLLIGVFLALFLVGSISAAPSPLAMMQRVAQNTITALKRNQSRLKGNSALIKRIVNRTLLPHVDIYSMSGRVVGRRYWLQASASERKEFMRLFKRQVISTYSGALSSYDQDRVLFYPLRGRVGTYAKVRSVIVRRSGQRIPVNYDLRYRGGRWVIVDFSVESVSMVNSFRSQYADTLSNGGVRALIAKMKSRG